MSDVIAPDRTNLPPAPLPPSAPLPASEIAATRRQIAQARADATRHEYRHDWHAFVSKRRTETSPKNGCNTLVL